MDDTLKDQVLKDQDQLLNQVLNFVFKVSWLLHFTVATATSILNQNSM